MKRIGALRLREVALAAPLLLLKDRDLEHVVAAELAGFELETCVFVDHNGTDANGTLTAFCEPRAVSVKRPRRVARQAASAGAGFH